MDFMSMLDFLFFFFFFQAEDGIRDFCLSRGLGDVYKRQLLQLIYNEAHHSLEVFYRIKIKKKLHNEQFGQSECRKNQID